MSSDQPDTLPQLVERSIRSTAERNGLDAALARLRVEYDMLHELRQVGWLAARVVEQYRLMELHVDGDERDHFAALIDQLHEAVAASRLAELGRLRTARQQREQRQAQYHGDHR